MLARNASTIGWIGSVEYCSPVRRASSAASSLECCDEWPDGIDTPYTCCGPTASTAIAATTLESMPPERPRTTERKQFLLT